MDKAANIPLSARELLDFGPESFLCLAALFLIGIVLFFLIEKTGRIRRKGIFRLSFLISYCLLCAAGIFWNSNRQEHLKRLEWAERIAFPRDKAFEKEFAKTARKLQEDTVLLQFFREHPEPEYRDEFARLIQERHFSTSFPDYLCFFTFCQGQEQLLIDAEATADCQEFFEQKAASGIPTETEGLSAMDYGIEYYAYLYRCHWEIPSAPSDTPATGLSSLPASEDTLFLNAEIGRKKFSDQPGSQGLHLPRQYSYAFYSEGDLWSHSGDFLYSFQMRPGNDSLHFDKWKHYSHLFFPLPESRLLILSTPEPNPWDIFHNFSLLFLIFGLLGAVCLWLTDKNFLGKAGSYAQQLRLSTFALIILVFIVFGGVSLYFLRQWSENENAKLLRNQTLSILTEMEERYLYLPAQEIHNESCGDSVCLSLNADIAQLSNLFRNDIYLYDTDGKLISGPSGFRLIPDSLDAAILLDLSEEQSHLVIRHIQFAGKRNGLLAFTPFRNVQNQILGYFCIPYYTHPDEIRSEMNQFIGTYLNIVVLMILVSLLLTYLLAQRISQPLSLIAQKVSQIRLTRKNEHLEWKRDDEIGALVKQYNVLVDELESSSRKLAESEREGAWNEMARQIAHEIKNPLTPMKLQVQQLQRAYKDQKPDFKERLERFASMLEGQIDHLAAIASMFSQFAQWQKPQMQAVSPAQILEQTCQLFTAEERIDFVLEIPPELKTATVDADPKYLEQILINLIRNAVQALEEKGTEPMAGAQACIRSGLRQIQPAGLEDGDSPGMAKAPGTGTPGGAVPCRIRLYVADNGPGIPIEKQSRIFDPHFTTRSTGTGLGLAICKRLAETMGGHISVKSEPGQGSCFSIDFPSSQNGCPEPQKTSTGGIL